MDAESYPKFRESIREIKDLISNRDERGSHLVVYESNNKVLEIKSGYQDELYLLPWTDLTVIQIYSLSVFSIIFTFADIFHKFNITQDARISEFLPTYADKEATLGHLLNSLVGFPYLSEDANLHLFHDDFDEFIKQFKSELPRIEPRKDRYFHYHTMSILADAIIRSVDGERGRNLAQYFAQEIAYPLNLDILVGLPRTNYYRLARNYHCTWSQLTSSALKFDLKAIKTQPLSCDCHSWSCYLFDQSSSPRCKGLFGLGEYNSFDPETLEIPLTSINTFSNAHSIAKLFDYVFFPPQDRPSYMKRDVDFTKNEKIMKWLKDAPGDLDQEWDFILNRYVKYNPAGFQIEESPIGTPLLGFYEEIMGHWVYVDLAMNLTMAYVTNHAHCASFSRDWMRNSIISSIYKSVKK